MLRIQLRQRFLSKYGTKVLTKRRYQADFNSYQARSHSVAQAALSTEIPRLFTSETERAANNSVVTAANYSGRTSERTINGCVGAEILSETR